MKTLNKYFDHTLLKADATTTQIKELCLEAKTYDFYSVCINTCHVPLAISELSGTDVKVAAVVGFPLGAMATEAKAYETDWACEQGAAEIDMVINIGAMKEGRYTYVADDISAVCAFASEYDAKVKVILETCLLTEEEIMQGCRIAEEAGADFVKTSTGFSTGGANVKHVALMKKIVGDRMGVKASGGIRDYETAKEMIEAGADRLGASASVLIMKEAESKGGE